MASISMPNAVGPKAGACRAKTARIAARVTASVDARSAGSSHLRMRTFALVPHSSSTGSVATDQALRNTSISAAVAISAAARRWPGRACARQRGAQPQNSQGEGNSEGQRLRHQQPQDFLEALVTGHRASSCMLGKRL